MNSAPHKTGLNPDQVNASRIAHGSNSISTRDDRVLWHVLLGIIREPMFIILFIACTIYFAVGQFQEGFIMLAAILIVAGISIFQEYRSRNAVAALKKLSAPRATVLRDGNRISVPTEDIVVGDLLMLEEGAIIEADGLILFANDLTVNESMVTGESMPVNKTAGHHAMVYKGTLVTSGSATIEVNAVGEKTMFGKIGLSLKEIKVEVTPLQKQIGAFVKYMMWIGAGAFLLVFGYNLYESRNFLHALMHGLTLAMSVIPEEIPVAFSTFMALGAYRLLKNNIIVKQPLYVETLGSATVICADKTGTLTQNRMSIASLYEAGKKEVITPDDKNRLPGELIAYAMWSSETDPFDPMEKAIHELYAGSVPADQRPLFKQVHEYPIGGNPPMMTHIFSREKEETLIAAKGAPEAILRQSHLSIAELKHIEEQSMAFARKGYRVLGVGKGNWEGKKWPVAQQDFQFDFLGLIAFYDPQKRISRRPFQPSTRPASRSR
ncbi:MAG: HAD-IC family P-type ATPase [Chitinophagaceae bacterium]|nr:HAD-IC family P-type ATPase [Chitinophagaceae bacterium]